jgi:DNA-binding MarR family transcriptional regulator
MAVSERSDLDLQERMVAFVRAFGLHRPDRTPCGQAVSVSEAHALMELARSQPATQNELAARLGLEKSTLSRLAGQLEAQGWVARARDPGDGRALRVRLTADGERAARRIGEARREKFVAVLAQIPHEERDAVLRALDVLTEAIRAAE